MGMKHHYSLRKIAAALSCIFIASVTFAGTSLTANAAATSITRISGNTRYETMGMVSRAAFLSAPPSKAAVVASGTDFPDALAASSLAGHLNAPFYSLIPNRFPTKRPTSLIDWMPMRFSSSAATKPSRIMLRTRFEQPIRLLPSHVSREAHVSIPHTAFTMSLPHLERSPKLQLFPLVSTSPTRFPYPHIHICNPRHFS